MNIFKKDFAMGNTYSGKTDAALVNFLVTEDGKQIKTSKYKDQQ